MSEDDSTGWTEGTDRELINLFLEVSKDSLALIEKELHLLEEDYENKTKIEALLRAFHTLKGEAAMLSFQQFTDLTHEVETLLDLAYRDELRLDADLSSMLFDVVDTCRYLTHHLEHSKSHEVELKTHVTALIDKIRKVAIHGMLGSTKKTTATTKRNTAQTSKDESQTIRVDLKTMLALEAKLKEAAGLGESLKGSSALKKCLQDCQSLAWELTTVSAQGVLQASLNAAKHAAKKLGKEIDIRLEGTELRLERSVAEKLKEAVQHLVRNAVDHGLESESERKSAGKPSAGKLCIRLSQKDHTTVLEVTDDGRGIVAPHVKTEARIRGIELEEEKQDPMEVLFRPGFTTAQQVTQLSGRGVGLDVVKVNVNEFGGKIEVDTVPTQGTTFRISWPSNP